MKCSACGATIRVPNGSAGSDAKLTCPACNALLENPEADGRQNSANEEDWKKALKTLAPVAFGGLAFVIGVWYFLPSAASDTKINAPARTTSTTDLAAANAPTPQAPLPTEIAPKPPASPATGTTTAANAQETFDPPPEFNPRLTRANFEQIKTGMSEWEVRDILGKPNSVRDKTDPEISDKHPIKVFQWAQTQPPEMIEVEFVNGLSSVKTTTMPAPAPSGKSGGAAFGVQNASSGSFRMTRENFERITNGMTENEVTAILGKPYERWHSTAMIKGPTTIMVWRIYEPDLTIKVYFLRGKVNGKNWILFGPKKP